MTRSKYDGLGATAAERSIQLMRLDTYKIDATLLTPTLPATKAPDRIPGWKRLDADDIAVIHVRDERTNPSAPEAQK